MMASVYVSPSSADTPSFDPGKIFATLSDFYTCLAKLPWIDSMQVL